MKNILITGGRGGILESVINKIKDYYNIFVGVHTISELKAIEKSMSIIKT